MSLYLRSAPGRVLLHKADVLLCLLLGIQDGSVVHIAHLVPHKGGHTLAGHDALAVFFQDLLVGVDVGVLVSAACVGAEVLCLGSGEEALVPCHHIGPDLVDIQGVGVVHHIRSVTAGGTHIDFQCYEITDFAETGFGLGQAEELHVHEASPDLKGLDCGAAHPAQGFGHLGSNIRITALITPLVDEAIGVSASIRLLHPSRVTLQKIVSSGMGTQDMIDFLCMCARYGISFVIAGVTSSGKTTLLNAIMTSMPNEKRIITIESGAREFDLVKKNRVGTTVNNVVHTLSRPSDNPAFDVPQELLVVGALRLNPHGIVIGEMRDVEAYAAVEASLTGHAVFSTVHAHAAEGAHTRIGLLCQKRFSIDFNTSLIQAAQAFPIVVYCHKLENNDRKIMDMTECEILPNGARQYHTLFSYHITKNEVIGGRTVTQGEFVRGEGISPSLQRRLLQGGVPRAELERFCSREVAA